VRGQNVGKDPRVSWETAMWWRVLLVGALLAGALGACAVVDPVDNRYDTVARSLAILDRVAADA